MSFYQTAEWRSLRLKVLKLYGEECMCCGKTPADTGKAPHVDHIYPRSSHKQKELDISNLQILCETCNCDLKGTYVVDYRSEHHRVLLEKKYGKRGKKVKRTLPLSRLEEAQAEYDSSLKIKHAKPNQKKREERRQKFIDDQKAQIAERYNSAPDISEAIKKTQDEKFAKVKISYGKNQNHKTYNIT